MQIQNLTDQDLESYKAIKLESLREEPLAFDSSFEEVSAWGKDQWRSKYKELTDPNEFLLIGLFEKDLLVGFLQASFYSKEKKKHIAELNTIYINRHFRTHGAGSKLMEKFLITLKDQYPHIRKIQLSVYSPQTAAINLYKKFEFEVYGEFKEELCIDEKYYDQIAMELFLN